jgi:epoxyqueuosine reductase QueG
MIFDRYIKDWFSCQAVVGIFNRLESSPGDTRAASRVQHHLDDCITVCCWNVRSLEHIETTSSTLNTRE